MFFNNQPINLSMQVSLRYIAHRLELIMEYNQYACRHSMEVMCAIPRALLKTCLESIGSALCLDEQLSRCHSQVGCTKNKIHNEGCINHPFSNSMAFYQLS